MLNANLNTTNPVLQMINDETKTLNDLSGFTTLKDYFIKNRDRPWNEWLSFKNTFDKTGKQGITGVLESKEFPSLKYCFKISRNINYLTRHEFNIMKNLNSLSNYCPHFCRNVGILECKLDSKIQKENEKNPFKIVTKYPVDTEVLLNEYIENSCKFYNYICSNKLSDSVIYSSVKQVLSAIMMAQQICNFTHYDLHSYNIMMLKCDPDIVFLYVLGDGKLACIPTYGHYPKIIDFGFSYSNIMKDDYLYPSLAHTDIGFISDRFDWLSDPKLFLVTVSKEIKNKRCNSTSIGFRNIIKNVFANLSIDWDSGWDNVDTHGVSEYITKKFIEHSRNSRFFKKYAYRCIDILQTLVIVPVKEQKNSHNFSISFNAFLDEFIKIENVIRDSTSLTYILKRIVDLTRTIQVNYLLKREETILYFTQSVYAILDSVSKYARPQGIRFEKLLCSLLSLAKSIEDMLFRYSIKKLSRKFREYNDIPVKTPYDIFRIIDRNIETSYTYNKNTTIFVFDTPKKECNTIMLNSDQIEFLNSLPNKKHADFLFECYKNK